VTATGPGAGVPDDRRVPHPDRLAPDHPRRDEILAAHEAALAAGRETYTDPATGFLVLTAQRLWDRGACCESGCRHCPWHGRGGDDDRQPRLGTW
jgi:hypothetical protein